MNQILFKTEARNNCNESFTTTVPTIIGNDRVNVKHVTERKIEDIMYTYVYPEASPPNSGGFIPTNNGSGVTFTYQSNEMYPGSNPTTQWEGSQLQYEVAAKQLEQHMLQNMIRQTHLNLQPKQLAFHLNASTSTSDLKCSHVQDSGTDPDDEPDNDDCTCCDRTKCFDPVPEIDVPPPDKVPLDFIALSRARSLSNSKKSTHVNLSPKTSEMPLPPSPPRTAKKISFSDEVIHFGVDGITGAPNHPKTSDIPEFKITYNTKDQMDI